MSCRKKCPYTDKNCVHSLPICKAYEKEYKPLTAIRCKIEVSNEENKIHQTNADRIRSMSDEELAELFVYWDCDEADYSTNLPINGCKWGSKEEMLSRVIDYLQSEVEE